MEVGLGYIPESSSGLIWFNGYFHPGNAPGLFSDAFYLFALKDHFREPERVRKKHQGWPGKKAGPIERSQNQKDPCPKETEVEVKDAGLEEATTPLKGEWETACSRACRPSNSINHKPGRVVCTVGFGRSLQSKCYTST